MIIGTYWDGFDDASQKLRLESLAKIKNFGVNLISMIADFSDPLIDDVFPAEAKKHGIDVMISPNTWDNAKLNTTYNPHTNVVAWHCMDDSDVAGLQATKDRIAVLKPFMGNKKSYITVSKGADHNAFGNLSDWYHIQNYNYREGNKKWNWTRMLEARAGVKGLLFQGPSLLKMRPIDFGIRQNNLMWMIDGEYTPLAYNKSSVMSALCAGANGIIYYTMFYGIAEQVGKNEKFYHHILERPDLVEGYKSFHAELQKYDSYWAINGDATRGTRTTFENGSIVGATFTLNNATKDWIRVEVDTNDWNPSYRIIDSKDTVLKDLFKTAVAPPAPASAKVTVGESQINITGTNVKFTT